GWLSRYTFYLFYFFFFQAEDGIRDFHVTGVQTCALPILLVLKTLEAGPLHGYGIALVLERLSNDVLRVEEGSLYPALYRMERREIGRAACRERGEMAGMASSG